MTKEAREQWQAFFLGMAACLMILWGITQLPGGLRSEYDKVRQEAVDKGYAEWQAEGDGKTKWSWKKQ